MLHWLGGGRRTDIDVLFEEFLGHLQLSLIRIQQQSIERINEQTGAEMNARLTFWQYLDPDLRAMKDLSDAQLGITDQDNIQDMQRRKRKAELLRLFNGDLKDFAKQAAYLNGSDSDLNRRLEQALEIARTSLQVALDDLRWEAGEPSERVPMADSSGQMKAAPSAETEGY